MPTVTVEENHGLQDPQAEDASDVSDGATGEAEQPPAPADADGQEDRGVLSTAEDAQAVEVPEGEVEVLIGDQPVAESDEGKSAPAWVKDLRRTNKEMQRRLREYEERERALAPPGAAPVLGPKPTIDQFNYDPDQFDAALTEWHEKKVKVDAGRREAEQRAANEQAAWNKQLEVYAAKKAALKVADYDDAEHAVESTLSIAQQSIIVQGANDPALVVYALGKHLTKAAELAAITDPVKFSFAIARLEAQLKTSPRAKPPAPERTLPAGTTSVAGGSDATLERLRAKAEQTGDMTPVIQYKAKLRAMKK
jgi:hypothetical protein